MFDIEQANELFEELGANAQLASIIFDPEDRSWTIAVDAETQVSAVLNDRLETLTFALGLGPLKESRAAQVHAFLLRFSYLWRETGGLFAALDDKGEPVLMFRCALNGLTPQALHALLRGLADQREAWAELMERDSLDLDDPQAYMPRGGIRV